MNIAMLWEITNPKTTLEANVLQAGEYYHTKYHKVGDTCNVHPSALSDKPLEVTCSFGIITVLPDPTITPWHLWLGVDDEP